MAPAPTPRRTSLWAAAAVAAVLAAGALTVLWTALWDRKGAFLAPHPPARWIVYPQEPQLNGRPAVDWRADFCRSFDLTTPPASALVALRAFRRAELLVNGVPVPPVQEPAGNWKSPILYDVSRFLQSGRNDVCVSVWNRFGPPALWLRLDAGDATILSDGEWEASLAGATTRPARLADEIGRAHV